MFGLLLALGTVLAAAEHAHRERVPAPPSLLRWVQGSLGVLVIGFAARLATADH